MCKRLEHMEIVSTVYVSMKAGYMMNPGKEVKVVYVKIIESISVK